MVVPMECFPGVGSDSLESPKQAKIPSATKGR